MTQPALDQAHWTFDPCGLFAFHRGQNYNTPVKATSGSEYSSGQEKKDLARLQGTVTMSDVPLSLTCDDFSREKRGQERRGV